MEIYTMVLIPNDGFLNETYIVMDKTIQNLKQWFVQYYSVEEIDFEELDEDIKENINSLFEILESNNGFYDYFDFGDTIHTVFLKKKEF